MTWTTLKKMQEASLDSQGAFVASDERSPKQSDRALSGSSPTVPFNAILTLLRPAQCSQRGKGCRSTRTARREQRLAISLYRTPKTLRYAYPRRHLVRARALAPLVDRPQGAYNKETRGFHSEGEVFPSTRPRSHLYCTLD